MTAPRPGGIYRRRCMTCGWSITETKSAARADWRKRKHSCDRWLRVAASHARGAARLADVDRTPRPCPHPAQHRHGTYAAYSLDRCRCEECTAATSAYNAELARRKAYGRFAGEWVPARPARDHVEALMAAGMGAKRVAAAADVAVSTVAKLVYGVGDRPPSKRLRRHTADALLGVALDLAPHRYVDGTGPRRRLQALVACGWTMTKLGRFLPTDTGRPMQTGNLSRFLDGDGGITAARAAAVRAVYERLWDTPPPTPTGYARLAADRARRYAADRGWLTPMWWDDDLIDDPDHRPDTAPARGRRGYDHAVVERFLTNGGERPAGNLTSEEGAEIVRRLREAGVSTTAMERLYRLKPERYTTHPPKGQAS